MEVTESNVQLPQELDGPFEVYINGVRQHEGRDFARRGDELVFAKDLKREGKLGFWRWTSLFLGVAGTYRQNDSVDLVFEVDGKKIVRTGLPILTEEPIATAGRREE